MSKRESERHTHILEEEKIMKEENVKTRVRKNVCARGEEKKYNRERKVASILRMD